MPAIEVVRPLQLSPTGGCELTVANRGSNTVYYGRTSTVGPTNYVGTLAEGESLTLTKGSVWVVASLPPAILDLRETEIASGTGSSTTPYPAVFLSEYWSGAESADGSAAFQAAAEAGIAKGLPLILDRNVTLEHTVTIKDAKEWKLFGQGYFGTGKIIDKVKTGPCLCYELTPKAYSEGKSGRPVWRDLYIELTVDKEQGVHIVEWLNMNVAQCDSDNVVIHGESHFAHSGLYLTNMADYAFRNWRMYRIKGHSWYYNLPAKEEAPYNFRSAWKAATAYALNDTVEEGGKTYVCIKAMSSGEDTKPPNTTFWASFEAFNGGNVLFDSCFEAGIRNGVYCAGKGTLNNVEWHSCKVNAEEGSKVAFYEKKESGEIKVGDEEITIEAKLLKGTFEGGGATEKEAEEKALKYFPRNGIVILIGAEHSEIVHLAQSVEPLTWSSGKLKLFGKVQNSYKTDYRVIAIEPWVYTGTVCPMVTFINCETEQRPLFLSQSSGALINCDLQPTNKSSTAKSVMVWVFGSAGGIGASHYNLLGNLYQKAESSTADKTTAFSMVYGLAPANSGQPPTVNIEYLQSKENEASQTNTACLPLDSPDTAFYYAEAGHRVFLRGKGVQLDTMAGGGGFRKVEGATQELRPSDGYVAVAMESGAELTLVPLPNKVVTLVQAGTNEVVLKPGKGGFNDEGETSGSVQILKKGAAVGNKKAPHVTLRWDSGLEKWFVTSKS